MAPRNADTIYCADDPSFKDELEPAVTPETHGGITKRPPMQIVWRNVIWLSYIHLLALFGLYLLPWASPATWAWTLTCYCGGALGITAGAHRLWSHRAYKARLPLRIFLAILNSMAFQNDIIEWSRDHRVHHKFSETDADPHNAKRGFFFSHMGWLLVRKHPDVKDKGKSCDMSDLYADPVCAFQRKYYKLSLLLLCFIMPTLVPWYFWEESLWSSFFINMLRLVLALNATWCVNSVAHLWGNRPYDRHINPVENILVSAAAVGEGYHNYHHTFPYDYKTSEYGWRINITSILIDTMYVLGQAYDRKSVSPEAIARRKNRTGDGTNSLNLFSSTYRK